MYDFLEKAYSSILQAYRLVFRTPRVERGVVGAMGFGCGRTTWSAMESITAFSNLPNFPKVSWIPGPTW